MYTMNSSNGNIISLALQRSFSTNSRVESSNSTLDEGIVASARRVLSTKIEYVHCPQQSSSKFLEALKSKYIVLKPKRVKKKKRNKHKNLSNDITYNTKTEMKSTEYDSQNLSLPAPKVILFPPEAVKVGWKEMIPVGSGLTNLGNTCYINSTLQALFHVPSFVNWLMNDTKHHNACEKLNGTFHVECIVCAMAKTLQLSHRQNSGCFRPRLIIEKVKMICKHLSPFRQEDAHEFLRYLMEAMEKSYITLLGIQAKKLDNYSKETTPLSQIFGGYIRTEVTCMECNHVSTTFQHFQDLILDIRQNGTTNVNDALENYFIKERLDGNDCYHCEQCKKKVSAYKKFSIEKAPNVLCIQLKRFYISASSFYGSSKISKLIQIPQTIDLNRFKHKKDGQNGMLLRYRLVSMVFHHGTSANSGHYTALGCTASGSYYYFNDEQVYPIHLGQYTSNPNAYIIFYELNRPNNNISENGFFAKREIPFSTSSNLSKQPFSWELNNRSPVKSAVIVPTANLTSKPSTTSLVPYISSDSDSSDSENDKRTDSNNNDDENTRTGSTSDSKKTDLSSTSSTASVSPLALKNSTLTSLLTSSPKNGPLPSPKFTPPVLQNGCNDTEMPRSSHQNGVAGSTHQLKRNFIPFSLYNRNKKKLEQRSEMALKQNNDCKEDESKTKMKQTGIAAMYPSKLSTRQNVEGNREGDNETTKMTNGEASHADKNHLTNGMKGETTTTNGWVVTDMKENGNGDGRLNESIDRMSKMTKGERFISQKRNSRPVSPASDESKREDIRENGRSNESSRNNSPQRNDSHNSSGGYSYSSLNGYGGKVLSWNGDTSYLNKEVEMQRKEAVKRNYYDDEQDRGKIKKPKYYGRNENQSNSQSPRKNLIQQHHNNMYRNNNNNHHHLHGNKRPWNFKQNSHSYRRGYPQDNYNRYNNYNGNAYSRTQHYVNHSHGNWRR